MEIQKTRLYAFVTAGIALLISLFLIMQLINFRLLLKKSIAESMREHKEQNELFAEKINSLLRNVTTIPLEIDSLLQKNNNKDLEIYFYNSLKKDPIISSIIIQDTSDPKDITLWRFSKNKALEKKNENIIIPQSSEQGWSLSYTHPLSQKKMIAFIALTKNNKKKIIIELSLNRLKKEVYSIKSSYLSHLVIKDAAENIIFLEQIKDADKNYILSIRNKKTQTIHLPTINWTIQTTYYPSTIPLGAIRSLLMSIFTSIALILCLIYITWLLLARISLLTTIYCLCTTLLIANCFLWLIIFKLPLDPVDNTIRINDPINCKKFIAEQKKEVRDKGYESPSISEVGMLVQYLDLNQETNAQVDVLLWQHTKTLKNAPGLTLMHNEGEKGSEVFHNNPENTTHMWLFNTKVTALDDETYYPLHTCYMKLEVVPTHLDKPIILIPDTSMQLLPNNPWISKSLQTPGYTLEDSFITTEDRDDAAIKKLTPPLSNKLIFHFIYREALIGALLNYILPLFIALFAIFGLLWFSEFPQDRFAGYTSTCFVTILLHSSLRTARKIITLSYLDFFFLYAYLAILICMAIAILIMHNQKKYGHYDTIMQYLYWPIQFFLWLITTAIMFY